MAATRVLVDTGPLVAYLNRRDRHHAWAVECWRALSDPLWTCEAVISEAVFLLQSEGADLNPVLQLVERQLVRLDFTIDDHRADVFRLLRKYRDQPMSVADACLVRMAELADQSQVFTTDRDFLVYRRKGRHTIPLLSPF
jgi:predicted nucleic acid-binding protein